MTSDANHWQRIYEQREPTQVSWFEPSAELSLALIAEAGLPAEAAILDAGGGSFRLAGQLLAAGYTDITVADIAAEGLRRAQAEVAHPEQIHWVQADLRSHEFGRRYLWHDRAVLHFMVDVADRERHLATLLHSLRPGGYVVLATFGPDGPSRCSGLPVTRYGDRALARLFGSDFELVSSRQTDHTTPSGAAQQFIYVHLRRKRS